MSACEYSLTHLTVLLVLVLNSAFFFSFSFFAQYRLSSLLANAGYSLCYIPPQTVMLTRAF